MRKDDAYLEDILEASKAIQRFTTGVSLEDFKTNEESMKRSTASLKLSGRPRAGFRPLAEMLSQKFPGS